MKEGKTGLSSGTIVTFSTFYQKPGCPNFNYPGKEEKKPALGRPKSQKVTKWSERRSKEGQKVTKSDVKEDQERVSRAGFTL